MDSILGYPDNLSEICEHIHVEYLPKNATSLIQTVEQQVIDKSDEKSSVKEVRRNYAIKDAIKKFGESWNEAQSGYKE